MFQEFRKLPPSPADPGLDGTDSHPRYGRDVLVRNAPYVVHDHCLPVFLGQFGERVRDVHPERDLVVYGEVWVGFLGRLRRTRRCVASLALFRRKSLHALMAIR